MTDDDNDVAVVVGDDDDDDDGGDGGDDDDDNNPCISLYDGQSKYPWESHAHGAYWGRLRNKSGKQVTGENV